MKSCIKGNRWLLFWTVTFSLLANVGLVLTSKQYEWFFDSITSNDAVRFLKLVVFAAVYILVVGILFYVYLTCSKLLIRRILTKLRSHVFQGIMERDMKSYYQQNTSEYLSVLTNDINLFEENWVKPMLGICESVGMFAATSVLLFFYSPLITLSIFAASATAFLVPALLGKWLSKRQKRLSMELAAFTNRMKDIFLGFDVIRSFNMLPHINGKFTTYNEDLAKRKYETDHFKVFNDTIAQVLGITIQVGTSCLSGYLVLKGQLSIGALAAVIQLCSRFVSPLMQIMNHMGLIRSMKPIIKKFGEMEARFASGGGKPPHFTKAIRVSRLCFSYGSYPVLEDVSLTLLPGKKYAVMGESGCGKSTLVKLLLGYYSNYQGDIFYDGENIRDIDLFRLNEMIAVIQQNVYMFDDTIKYNICLQQEFSEESFEKALKSSCLYKVFMDEHDVLVQPSQGGGLTIDSRVGENGCSLSGGQRQRIAIARALIRKTPVLILDEGTSAVDIQSAYEIEESLLEMDHLTLISIEHRTNEALLQKYDEIIYMRKGRVAEVGSFRALMERKKDFYDFYTF